MTKREKPVRIPIPFEQFVEGVLKIDPKKLAETSAQKAAKKPAAKKKGG